MTNEQRHFQSIANTSTALETTSDIQAHFDTGESIRSATGEARD